MSISEILVICLIAIFVLKPEDIPRIAQALSALKSYFDKIKNDLLAHFDTDALHNSKLDTEAVNFYLEKIANMGHKYEGGYSLEEVKNKYFEILQNKMNDLVKSKQNDQYK